MTGSEAKVVAVANSRIKLNVITLFTGAWVFLRGS